MRSDDHGQMMLLAAVVLVVAFLALSVMVGRIATIEPETQRDSPNALLGESDVVVRGACAAFRRTATQGELGVALDYLEIQLAGRGLFVTFVPNSASNAGLTLRDARSTVTLVVDETTDC